MQPTSWCWRGWRTASTGALRCDPGKMRRAVAAAAAVPRLFSGNVAALPSMLVRSFWGTAETAHLLATHLACLARALRPLQADCARPVRVPLPGLPQPPPARRQRQGGGGATPCSSCSHISQQQRSSGGREWRSRGGRRGCCCSSRAAGPPADCVQRPAARAGGRGAATHTAGEGARLTTRLFVAGCGVAPCMLGSSMLPSLALVAGWVHHHVVPGRTAARPRQLPTPLVP